MKSKYISHPQAEKITGAQRVIQDIWSDVNEGLIHKISGISFSIADAGHDDFVILTPGSKYWVDVIGLVLIGEGNPWNVELYEAPTLTPGDETDKISRNINRRIGNDDTNLKFYDASTVTDDGLLLDEGIFGGVAGQGNQQGGLGGGEFFQGWILAPDTYYNIRIVNNTGALATIGTDFAYKEVEFS
jgi:hypothetical protein